MAATVVPSLMVNVKALNQDNYNYWIFRVKTYLLAEDLWEVVEGTNKPPKVEDPEFMAWQKINARALQAIIIFCGEDAEFFIKYIMTAKDAWEILVKQFKPLEILESPGEETHEVDLNDGVVTIDDEDLENTHVSLRRCLPRNGRL